MFNVSALPTQLSAESPLGLAQTRSPSVAAITSVSALDAAKKPRHRWYFFKEAFSPEVVDRAVADSGCGTDDLIVDPFCGSGTVPLQAALLGRRSSGTEVSPFLAFVARTKLARCHATTFEAAAERAVSPARRGCRSPLSGFSTFSDAGGADKWLFSQSVLEAFEGAWRVVDIARTPSASLVKLCLLGAAMDVCNATRDGKCLRYRKDWRERDFGKEDFIAAFQKRVADVAEDLRTCPIDQPFGVIECRDARRRGPQEGFKLCVTSPPYLNSFDYTDVYRPELFLGKWVGDMAQLRALRFRTLRSHVQVDWKWPTHEDFGTHYAEAMKELSLRKEFLWCGRIPVMIQAYFEDMRRILTNLRAAARKDASVWIVVSTSAYAGVEVPVDLIIAEIGAACGWYLREVSVLRYLGRVAVQQWAELSQKKSNKPHLRESVVILDALPRGR